MFGYLKPDNPYLYLKDETLYKALYCGICKSIGKTCGQKARVTLTYDMAFMSAIAHNIMGVDVKINRERCIAHQIKKRPVAQPDDISLRLGAINVILAYYKVKDDIYDDKKGGFKSNFIKGGYKKAKELEPKIEEIVKSSYERLRKLESENLDSIDMVSDAFADMMQSISLQVFNEFSSEYTSGLFYSIGKWIYLIDALDDYDNDVQSKSFNVLYNAYKAPTYKELILNNKDELFYLFNGIFAQISENFKNIPTKFNTDLVNNILMRGIPESTKKILVKGMKND